MKSYAGNAEVDNICKNEKQKNDLTGIDMNDDQRKLKIKEPLQYKYALEMGANVVITDKDGAILHVNDIFCATCGYSREELIGQNPRLLNSGYHPKEFWTQVFDTITAGKVWRGEIKNKAKDGSFHWLDTTIVPFLDEHGKPYQYMAMRYDITQRKDMETRLHELNADLENRVEERTRESEGRRKYFTALIENSSDAVVLINRAGNIVYQSPAAERMADYHIEDTYGKPAKDFIHPDDAPDFVQVMQYLAQHPGETMTKQYQLRHKDGHFLWVEGTMSSQLHDKIIKAFIVNYRDISERKLAENKLRVSEELYRSLFENMLNGFAYCQMHYDEQGKPCDFTYLSTNHVFEKLTGLKDVTGKKVTELIPGIRTTDQGLLDRYGRVALSGNPDQFEIYMEALKDWYWISVYSPEKGYFVSVFEVITIRKQAEIALEKLNAGLEEQVLARTHELREANKALEAFSYSASHDLRAPLRTIIGFCQVIRQDHMDKMDPEMQKMIGYILDSGKRMSAIIEDLLALSKYSRKELSFVPVNMVKLVKDVWAGISISTPHHAAMELGHLPVVQADLSTIEQVVLNLISNAVKYSSKKEHPVVKIWSEKTSENIVIYFKDNGTGFNMKNYDRLFTAFQRLHGASEFEGTGIGLALVKQIVEKHGGTVGAEGKAGEGATFYFTLPISDEPNNEGL